MEFLFEQSLSSDPFLGVLYEQNSQQTNKPVNKNMTLEDMPIPDDVDDATFIDSFFEKSDESFKAPIVHEELSTRSQGLELYSPTTSMGDYDQNNWFYEAVVDAGSIQQCTSRNEIKRQEVYQEIFKSDEEDDELEKAVIETARICDRPATTIQTFVTHNYRPTAPSRKIVKYTGPTRCPSYVQFPYSLMIGLALKNGGRDEEAVKSIYTFCNAFFKSYRMEDERWKKSLRHCISTCHLFRKGMRNFDCTGYFWKFSPNGLHSFNLKLAEFTQRHPSVEDYGLWNPEDWQDIVSGTKGIPSVSLETRVPKTVVRKQISPEVTVPPPKRILYPVKVIMQQPPRRENHLRKTAVPLVGRPFSAASKNFPGVRYIPYCKAITTTTTANKMSVEKAEASPYDKLLGSHFDDTDVNPFSRFHLSN